MRLELMGKAVSDIHAVAAIAHRAGITSFNIPNKDKKDNVLKLAAAASEAVSNSDVVPHFSIAKQLAGRDGAATFE
jgi:hypothetical protein